MLVICLTSGVATPPNEAFMYDTDGKLVAVISNPLLRRKLSLDVVEQRVFHLAVGQIEDPWNEKDKLPLFKISVEAYAALTGRSGGSLYEEIKNAVKALQHTEVRLPGGERIAMLAPYAEYMEGEGRIEIEFNERLKPYILGVRKYYAKVPVAEVCKLRSGYAVSFYLYCWSWYGSKERGWYKSVEELRDWLSIKEGTLERVCDLKMWAIEQPRRELNAKSSITFTAKAERRGRQTVGWFFKVKDNEPERRKPKGSVELSEKVRAEGERLKSERRERAKARWMAGTEEEHSKWLEEMNRVERVLVPADGVEPGPMFLDCLAFRIFEPGFQGLE